MCSGQCICRDLLPLDSLYFSWTNLSFMASSIWNCISLWVLLRKSHHVKFTTVALTVNILSWCYAELIHFIFLWFWNCSIYVTLILTHIMSNPLSETYVFYCWESITWELWIKAIGCCYGMHNDWSLGNMTPLLHLNLSFILHLTIL